MLKHEELNDLQKTHAIQYNRILLVYDITSFKEGLSNT